ncbi:MAG: hypothetical protein JWR00_342 [Rubritepida sp.]|nr:hypothetical protein [Rubritepida sp.]
MMRCLPLMLVLALGACDSLDTSPGSSGVPDIPMGRPDFVRGSMSTSGQIIMNRELPSPR